MKFEPFRVLPLFYTTCSVSFIRSLFFVKLNCIIRSCLLSSSAQLRGVILQMDGGLTALINLAVAIKDSCEKVKCNKKLCEDLGTRILFIANSIPKTKKLSDNVSKGIENLRTQLNASDSLVKSFIDAKWYMNMLNSNQDFGKFQALHLRIDRCMADLSVSDSTPTLLPMVTSC